MAKRLIGYRSNLKKINAGKYNNSEIARMLKVTRATIIRWMSDEIMPEPSSKILLALAGLYKLKDYNQLLEPVYGELEEPEKLGAGA